MPLLAPGDKGNLLVWHIMTFFSYNQRLRAESAWCPQGFSTPRLARPRVCASCWLIRPRDRT